MVRFIFHLLKYIFYSGILVCAMSKVWKDANGCAKQYRCALAIFLITVLSSSYSIIMDIENNAPGHLKNVVDGLNETNKRYLK